MSSGLLKGVLEHAFTTSDILAVSVPEQKTAGGILLPKGPPKANSDAHFGTVIYVRIVERSVPACTMRI